MTTIAEAYSPVPGSPEVHRWTIHEYQRFADLGLLDGRKTELADGVIVDMAAQKDPHRIAVSRLARALMSAFDDTYLVTIQSTIRLSSFESREPDAAVEVPPAQTDGHAIVHPLLLVEVSDETLLYDQVVKASLYAAHRVPDYWIVNVRERQLEVYREPVVDTSRRYGWRYSDIRILKPGENVSPVSKPEASIAVAGLFP